MMIDEEIDTFGELVKKKVLEQSKKLHEIQLIQKSLEAITNPYVIIDDESGDRDEFGHPKKIKYRNGVKNNPLTNDKFTDIERQNILNKAKTRLENLS